MTAVWRFTGPPENWITAISLGKWAFNEHNRPLWEKDIRPGDVALFHSTRNSEFSDHPPSSIIGFGYIGEGMTIKNDYWWVQEIRDQQNQWPYVVPLKEIYLFSDITDIDFATPVDRKGPGDVRREIRLLVANAIPVSELNTNAIALDPNCPNFPVNGSASRVNRIYEELILERNQEYFIPHGTQETALVEERLAEEIDEQLSRLDKKTVLEAAKAFDNRGAQSHSIIVGPRKMRKESQVQKRRIAALEDYTCQVCGFRYEYVRENGKKAWIIHVDHIVEKADNGSEYMRNLWVLCPNCHAKKTYGIIKMDLRTRRIVEGDREIKLFKDGHLFV
jgi:5-methylcytosine-specific restriction endonuclease McrA